MWEMQLHCCNCVIIRDVQKILREQFRHFFWASSDRVVGKGANRRPCPHVHDESSLRRKATRYVWLYAGIKKILKREKPKLFRKKAIE